MLKVICYILLATVAEAVGDAVIRSALHSTGWSARVGLFLLGTALLAAYGTALNLAPVDFASATGIYIALLFVTFQVVNYLFFGAVPQVSTLVGGTLIVAGGIIVYAFRKPELIA